MAAFSYQDPRFLLDSVFFPNLNPFLSSCGHQPMLHQQGSSIDANAHENSCVEQQSFSNEPSSVTEKQGTKQSFVSMANNKADSGEQVTQNLVPLAKKRKSRSGSSSNSANSKDAKQAKCKKQKGEKEPITDEKNDKNDQNQATEDPPKGYIHVRARRGQATDSHSLAERVRREKISERMKMLQALVPGCDKVTGKALMLDEIINYVQSLQNQVEFLSMKLASLDPMVYTFGLMDLDPMAFGTEGVNNSMGIPMPLMQPTSSSGSTAQPIPLVDTASAITSTSTTSFPSPLVDSSASLLQQEQKPNVLPLQDGRSLYWGMDEQQQRQSTINQFGFGANNLYSFH